MGLDDVLLRVTRASTENMADIPQGQGHPTNVIPDTFSFGADTGQVFNSSGGGLASFMSDALALSSDLTGGMARKDNFTSLGSEIGVYGTGTPGPAEFLQYHNAVTTAISSNVSVVIDGSTLVPEIPHTLLEVVLISIVVIILCIITAGGNLMVMISFKMDKQLQTVSNYFLLSLSVADFAIGIISMPLYSLYLIMNRWPLGPIICDTWLSLDYTMSNASVANLLIISFDRYLSVTKPLSYRAKRTPKRAAIMISCAWIISAAMWTPWIFAWPHIEGERTVRPGECEIQFLSTNQYITIITAIAAFYLPVVIMSVLYYKIYQETERRQRDLASLQANRNHPHRHHHHHHQHRRTTDSSDDDVYVNLRRNDSSPDFEDIEEEYHGSRLQPKTCWQRLCRIDRETDYMEDSSSSDPGSPTYARTPSSSAHGVHGRGSIKIRDQNCHPADVSQQNGKRHPAARSNTSDMMIPLINVDSTKTTPTATPCSPSTDVTAASLSHHSHMSSIVGAPVSSCGTSRMSDVDAAFSDSSQQHKHTAAAKMDSDIYTILIKLPQNAGDPGAKPTIQMLSEEESEETDLPAESEGENIPMTTRSRDIGVVSTDGSQSDSVPFSEFPSVGRRFTQCSDAVRTGMQARFAMRLNQQAKSQRLRRKRQEKKQEKKAAKTLSAILLAFIITWTPYNVFTVINVFWPDIIPGTLYAIGYWLCYINSTINPICYALCNANFRRTYWRILTCKFLTRAQPQHSAGYRDTVRERDTSYVTS